MSDRRGVVCGRQSNPVKPFTFIDLFAGIGGFRLAFEAAGGNCLFASEWDTFAQKTYAANFGHTPAGDITQISTSDIPDHDILTAGFPCTPFSLAGVSKNNALGRTHGFAHVTQGTLFFDVARIIADKRPAAFVLENVKNLRNHDRGRTFEIIQETLADELGYHIQYAVLDAKNVVPQHRERIYIVGFREPISFQFPTLPPTGLKIRDILEADVPAKYTLSDKLWAYLQNYARKHQAKGNGFGFGLVNLDGTARTLSARYYKDGSEILIPQSGKNPRRLTPRECARLMGYPDSYQIVCSDSRAYKQFGNSVVVPVVSAIAHQVVVALEAYERNPLD
ncbi:MAG: DNA (cytosine-5-)-methyltransferase [Anaerolineae bacterium]|nr:DNA (cytosine-5-)-methyltransferase [Anaerolineae bacterium]